MLLAAASPACQSDTLDAGLHAANIEHDVKGAGPGASGDASLNTPDGAPGHPPSKTDDGSAHTGPDGATGDAISSFVGADGEGGDGGGQDDNGQGTGESICLGDDRATGCPCEAPEQCASDYCVATDAGMVCVETCVDTCPEAHACLPIQIPPDIVFLCLPRFAKLCQPCTEHAECQARGDQGVALCVDYGDAGRFCGAPCKGEGNCPEGYSCEERMLPDGSVSSQCLKLEGECECNTVGSTLAMVTECKRTNEHGSCRGRRACGPAWLGECDALAPAAEVCDGEDNDCDGEVDNVPAQGPCYIESPYGACEGKPSCADGEPICVGQTPQPEICNGVDDDCDGSVDESTCDDGLACTIDACDTTAKACVFQAIDEACDDGNPCTIDVCDSEQGCLHTDLVGSTCDDGNPCTIADACVEGRCQGTGLPACCAADEHCDDHNPCTRDTCLIETGTCEHDSASLEGKACEGDGDGCTVGDTCVSGSCRIGEKAECGDSPFQCLRSVCRSEGAHQHRCDLEPLMASHACSDGDVCTVSDACDGEGSCVGGERVPGCCREDADCDDQNGCTVDLCEVDSGQCVQLQAADGTPCDADGTGCTDGDTCLGGSCRPGPRVECASLGPCSHGECVSISFDEHRCAQRPSPDGTACSDDNPCTVGDACDGNGLCEPGEPSATCCHSQGDCDDFNPCTADACDMNTGKCSHVQAPDGTRCDADGDGCTVEDACESGVCRPGEPADCGGRDADCVVGACTSIAPHEFECDTTPYPQGTPCSDGDVCTKGDACDGKGACVPGEVPPVCCRSDADCDDGNACTNDTCDESSGACNNTDRVDGTSCDADGDGCTVGDTCRSGECEPGAPADCSGLDVACSHGVCEAANGSDFNCVSKARESGAPCSDGEVCTVGDSCNGAGECVGGEQAVDCCRTQADCDDGNACTADVCDTVSGGCAHHVRSDGTACDDGDACTQDDTCESGSCLPGPRQDCSSAGAGCLMGVCESDGSGGFACVTKPSPPGAPCDDGQACTLDGSCDGAGSCDEGPERDCEAEEGGECLSSFCDELEGGCVTFPRADGLACEDGDQCTTSDRCVAGTCVPGLDSCVEERLSNSDGADRGPELAPLPAGRWMSFWTVDSSYNLSRWSANDGGREGRESQVSAVNQVPWPCKPATSADGKSLVAWRSHDSNFALRLYDHRGVLLHSNSFSAARAIDGHSMGRVVPLSFADGTWALTVQWMSTSYRNPELIRLGADLSQGQWVKNVVTDAGAPEAWDAVTALEGDAFWWVAAHFDGPRHLDVGKRRSDASELLAPVSVGKADSFVSARIALRPDGGVAVVWQECTNYVHGGCYDDVLRMRVLGPDGRALSEVLPLALSDDGEQLHPGVASFSDGAFVTVHSDTREGGGVRSDIVATIWEPVGVGRDGAPVERSQTIIVNARRFGDQTLPTVTVLDDDDFVVAWVGEDGAVWTRRFHRDGTHATGRLERPANQTITGKQHEPAAAATRGNVMVAYTSAMFAGGDTEILGRVLDPDGAEVRREERLHGADTRDQRRPAVAGSEAGFVVVWDNMVGNATKGISGHRFDTTGAPLGGLISIEESPAEVGELHPAVAALPDGSFVVVHGGRKSNNGARAVATRAFDKDGAPLSSVSAFEPVGRRPDAAVAAHPTRDSYAAAWLHESSGIRLAILSRDGGVASGPVFAISSDAADPSVAVSADDRIALCWNTPYTDSRLYCRIFAYDGFHPFGSDITVFPNMPSGQARAKVAWLRTGGFLVAGDTNRVDLDGHAVLVRPFDSLGFAGNPIRLANRAQPGNQLTAFIIPVSTSRVWVGWQGPEPDGEDVGVRFRILERL